MSINRSFYFKTRKPIVLKVWDKKFKILSKFLKVLLKPPPTPHTGTPSKCHLHHLRRWSIIFRTSKSNFKVLLVYLQCILG